MIPVSAAQPTEQIKNEKFKIFNFELQFLTFNFKF